MTESDVDVARWQSQVARTQESKGVVVCKTRSSCEFEVINICVRPNPALDPGRSKNPAIS